MVDIRALGPLQASSGGEPVTLGGSKQRTVLALLIASDGQPVSDDVLIDGVWGDAASAGSRSSLQTYISNLRRALGHDVLPRVLDGYRLDLPRGAVDVWRFQDEIGAGRFSSALELWRGRPYSGTEPAARLDDDARRLEELRLAALERHLEAKLEAGEAETIVPELETLTTQHPTREQLRALHMLALYRSGRQTEALEVYQRTREHLASEVGVDPGPSLRKLHQLMLEQDTGLVLETEVLLDPDSGRSGGSGPTALPSGIVTFLFTDIQGSTRLFHDLGDDYSAVLEQQRRLLRDTWSAHSGHEVGVEGDGALVAFGSAVDAAHASVAAQRALASATWPEGVELRVRMGMHTGLAWPRGHDYISLTVHEAARVMAAAHGGQILLSEQTAEKLGDLDGIDIAVRGRFRLRGFEHPVRLYELRAEGLEHDFGPVRATPADGHNLVRQPTETIGRERLVTELTELLVPGRLVTLTGPGGVGKTRVASEVGMSVAPGWQDGVWFADLATVTEPQLVIAAVADAVAAPTGPGGDRADDLVNHLRGRHCVVILDNCEHVVVACRELLDPVFVDCPGIAFLATSREPLHWPGELLRPVGPLDVPHEGAATAEVREASGARLFELRGAAVRPGFAITEDNAEDVAAICRQLDGLPLLIELAAALLRVTSPREIRAGLRAASNLLESPDPMAPDRHRSVEGLIGWSYRLLSDGEQTALRRLSAFGASFSLETATAAIAVGDVEEFDAPRLLWSLVDRSLVAADLAANETRYRLLATIRRYGRQRLDEQQETVAVAVALADALLGRLGPWLPTGLTWVGEVGVEIDNLRALVPLLADAEPERAQAIACSIGRYHDATQSFREGIRELRRYADTLTEATVTRVALLARLADLYLRTGDVDAADRLVQTAATLQDSHGAPDWDDAAVDRTRGEIARRRGDLDGAVAIAQGALERDLSDRGRSRMYNLLGTTLAALGDLEAARGALEEELVLNRTVGHAPGVSASHGNLAEVALRLGDTEQAAFHQRSCLELALAQRSLTMIAFSLIVAARLAGDEGRWETAVQLHARAEVLLAETGLTLYEDDQQQSDRLLADARGELGDAEFDRATQAGRRLAVDDAAELADEVLSEIEPPALRIDADDEVGVHI